MHTHTRHKEHTRWQSARTSAHGATHRDAARRVVLQHGLEEVQARLLQRGEHARQILGPPLGEVVPGSQGQGQACTRARMCEVMFVWGLQARVHVCVCVCVCVCTHVSALVRVLCTGAGLRSHGQVAVDGG